MRQVTHALLTRPPLSHSSFRGNQSASFDLHVLGTPPAFILSQDQTLVRYMFLAASLLSNIIVLHLDEELPQFSPVQNRLAILFLFTVLLGLLQTAHEARNNVPRSFGFANARSHIRRKTSFPRLCFTRAVLSLF